MSPDQFAPLWADMLAAWPQNKPAPGAARLYAERLADFDATEVRRVVDAMLVEEEWFPPLAKLWKACLELRTGLPGWEQAWESARRAVSAATVRQQHPAVRDAIHAIGVWEIRTATNAEAIRSQFRDVYQRITARQQRDIAIGVAQLPAPSTVRQLHAPPPPEQPGEPQQIVRSGTVVNVLEIAGNLAERFAMPDDEEDR